MGRLPDGAQNPSIVYASYMRQRPGTPTTPGGPRPMITEMAPMSAATAQWLQRNGVRTVVVGHQPVGDVPLYMEAHGVQVCWVFYTAHILICCRRVNCVDAWCGRC